MKKFVISIMDSEFERLTGKTLGKNRAAKVRHKRSHCIDARKEPFTGSIKAGNILL